MILFDVIYIPPTPKEVDTVVSNPNVQDTIVFVDQATSATGGGSSLLDWGFPALIAALAATLFFIFKFSRQQTEKVRPA